MNKEDVKITFGGALLLQDVVNKLLVKEVIDEKGNKKLINRELPFRLSYRLNRNKIALDRDVEIFSNRKLYLLATFGVYDEEKADVIIKDKESYESYKKGLKKLLGTEATHNVITLELEDIDLIKDFVDVNPNSMQLFIKYMTKDHELLEDLCKDVKIDLPEFTE